MKLRRIYERGIIVILLITIAVIFAITTDINNDTAYAYDPDIHNATKLNAPSSDIPLITVLTHMEGGTYFSWSNVHETNYYHNQSLIETLRLNTDAKVYMLDSYYTTCKRIDVVEGLNGNEYLNSNELLQNDTELPNKHLILVYNDSAYIFRYYRRPFF